MDEAKWIDPLGLRVGQVLRFAGDELRFLGLEPPDATVAPYDVVVTKVSSSEITLDIRSRSLRPSTQRRREPWLRKG